MKRLCEADDMKINVFNYEDVHKELIKAVVPFRGKNEQR